MIAACETESFIVSTIGNAKPGSWIIFHSKGATWNAIVVGGNDGNGLVLLNYEDVPIYWPKLSAETSGQKCLLANVSRYGYDFDGNPKDPKDVKGGYSGTLAIFPAGPFLISKQHQVMGRPDSGFVHAPISIESWTRQLGETEWDTAMLVQQWQLLAYGEFQPIRVYSSFAD